MSEEPSAAPAEPSAEESLEPAAEAERQFHQEVLPDELAYVADRRASHGLTADSTPGVQPEVNGKLIGLALSGGGIRSATFNLGLLQALHHRGFLRCVDYLSTVSGGGFIGSALTALASENARKGRPQDPESFPFEHRDQARESAALGWLRGHSEYLAPQGLFDYLKAFALFTRGLALNLLLLLPILSGLGLLGALVWDDLLYAHGRQEAWIEQTATALADSWGSEPATVTRVDDLLAQLEIGEGFDRRRVFEALEADPALVAIKGEGRSTRFTAEAGWPEIARRLAGVEDSRPWQRAYAVRSGRSLTYSHVDGLWEHPFEWRSSPRYFLWTDRRPVSAAAFSPDGRLIGAVGYDGSVWAWTAALEAGALAKRKQVLYSRHPASAPLAGVRFSNDSRWLIALGADGSVLVWSVVDRPGEPQPELRPLSPEDQSPLCNRCEPAIDPQARSNRWQPQHGSRFLVPGQTDVVRLNGLPGGAIEMADPWAREARPGEPQLDRALGGGTVAPPRARTEIEIPPKEKLWVPEVLRLDASFTILKWLLVAFVLAYPIVTLLGTPLKGFARATLIVVGLMGLGLVGMGRKIAGWFKAQPAPAAPLEGAETGEDGKAKGRGFFAVVLLAVLQPLALLAFGLIGWEDLLLDAVTAFGATLLFFWWVLSAVLFVPMFRFWGSRANGTVGSRSITGLVLRLLVLLPPCVYVARFLTESLGRPLAWAWLLLVVLLAWPLVRYRRPPAEAGEDPRRRRIRNRRLAARIFAAVGLLPWLMVSAALARSRGGYAEEAINAALPAATASGLTSAIGLPRLACGVYLAAVVLICWKAFARLAGGRAELAAARIRRSNRRWTTKISSSAWRGAYERAFGLALVALGVSVFLEIQPYLVFHYHRLRETSAADWSRLLLVASFVVIVLAVMTLSLFKGLGRKLVLLVLGVLGALLPLLLYLRLVEKIVYLDEPWSNFRRVIHPPDKLDELMLAAFLLLTTIAAAYLLSKLVDANLTSMHGFYRDRLSQGYLVGVDTDGRIGPEEELDLTDICPPGSGAPYHLINASLNMQGEGEGALRWRNSDFFIFSKHWCGGPQTGYCRTKDMGYLAPDLHLGSAMAVSGAAASPNMGSYTSRALVMLMTFLNVRLGLWLPNPRRVRRLAELGEIEEVRGLGDRLRRWRRRLAARPSGYYLVHEMFSRLHAQRPYVNLSDGGHLENTGAYELLRRRCGLIVIGDAEADPAVTFGSLAALIRYARIDLGIEIDMDLGPLRAVEGVSDEHYVIGTIVYPPSDDQGAETEDPESVPAVNTGFLCYIKTSLTGDEGEAIREYRARHPTFPHESTADQGFEEDQFEAYRALGYHIGYDLVARAGQPGGGHGEIADWVGRLGPETE